MGEGGKGGMMGREMILTKPKIRSPAEDWILSWHRREHQF